MVSIFDKVENIVGKEVNVVILRVIKNWDCVGKRYTDLYKARICLVQDHLDSPRP